MCHLKILEIFCMKNHPLNREWFLKRQIKSGDLANQLFRVKKLKDDQITIILPDGSEALTTLSLLNIDPKSIRPYNPSKDPKFRQESYNAIT